VELAKDGPEDGNDEEKGKELVSRMGTMTVSEERDQKAKTTHWLAVGSKDGKVSLWDIY
jgi:ASTRA-associated protein 1